MAEDHKPEPPHQELDPQRMLPAHGSGDVPAGSGAARPGRETERRGFHPAPAKPKPITDPGHMLPQKASADEKGGHRKLIIFIVVALVLALLLFLVGWLPAHRRNQQLKKEAQQKEDAKPVVEVMQVKPGTPSAGLAVPGTTIPLTEAYVYARANGYLKQRFVDIGDHVRAGQLLAIIDAPDLDQQVDQARQQVRQAEDQLSQQKANLALAQVTEQRYQVLVAKGVFSRQQGDQQESAYQQQAANVAAAARNVEAYKANLRRTIALQSYERVTAPFSGIVTQRNVDVGALISASGATGGPISGPAPMGQMSTSGGTQQAGQSNNAGSSGSTPMNATPAGQPGQGGPLFGIAQVERLRILVAVPEGYATSIRPGVHARIAFQEYPANAFDGDVTRTAGSIDQNTRTLLTEVQVDNREGRLLPGMYAVVTFPPPPGPPPLTVPGDAIVIRNDQSVLATVVNGHIRYAPITIGRDYGTAVEIANGIRAGDLVVTNVTDEVAPGRAVQTRMVKQATQAAPQKPEQAKPLGGDTQYGNEGITDTAMQGKQSQANGHGKGQSGKQASTGSKP